MADAIGWRSNEWQRIFGINVQPHASEFGPKIRSTVSERATATIAGGDAEDYILGKIFIQRSKPIAHPCAEARMFELARMTTGLPGELRAVIIVNRPKRTDHRDIIRAFAEMPKPIAHHEPGFAVLFIAALQ